MRIKNVALINVIVLSSEMSSYEKREEAITVPVRKLIKQLTGFKDGDVRLEECERYALPNLLNDYRYPMVDKTLIQRSVDSFEEKFKLHGFYEKAKLLKELSAKIKTDEEWSVVLLLIRLSHKPLCTVIDVSSLESFGTAAQEEKEFDWKAYLKEGWEEFELPPDDSDDDDCWVLSDLEDTEEGKELITLQTDERNISVSSSDVTDTLWILQEGLEPLKPPAPIKKHTPVLLTEKDIYTQIEYSKNWLKNHVQNSWWKSGYHEYQSKPISDLESANLIDRWETFVNKDVPVTEQCHAIVLSEYKVLREIIWMLQAPTDCCIFYKDSEDGKFKARKNVTIPSTTTDSLHSLLTSLCPYFDIVDLLHQFKQSIISEREDSYIPYTYKAYNAAVSNELYRINNLVLHIEREVHKQDGINTLVTVMEQLNPVFAQLRFLCNIHFRGITDWRSEPSWLCVTRLLTVLYTALQEGVNVEMSLRLFIYSFRVYFDIIDVWLYEGRLDFQHEFLVQREDDHLKVMPYTDEMRKCGIAPVSILTKLAHVVKDAGRAVELVGRLNKLNQLRDTVDNKGFLYKEFLENVNQELQRLKCHYKLRNMKASEADKESEILENKVLSEQETSVSGRRTDFDKNVGINTNQSENKSGSRIICGDNKLLDNDKSESKSNLLRDDTNLESKGSEEVLISEDHSEKEESYIRLVDSAVDVDNALYRMSTEELLDNPLLYCVFEEYLKDSAENTLDGEAEDPLNSLELGGEEVLSILPLLDSQLNLVRRRCMLANKIITESLITEHNLLQHLTVLRKVFLMEAGNIVQNFYTYLFQEIGFGDWGNSVGLSVQLKLSVEEEHPNLASNFTVIIDRKKGQSGLSIVHSALNLYFFGYNVGWPVNLIITPECIAGYNKVFKFLLKIKFALWSVNNLRVTDLKENPDNRHRVYRLYSLKFWLSHCVNTIHAYFMILAPWHSGKILEDSIREAESIDDMISAHKRFLDAAMNHCLQEQASRLEPFIINLLHVCSQLRAVWYLELKGDLTTDVIGALEMEYVRVHCILGTILQAMVESAPDLSANIGHLDALAYEICCALPEQSFTVERD